MTGELRSVLFHVRRRLIQIHGSLIQDQAAAESQPMTVGEAIRYLKQAINLELARTHVARRAPLADASRAERGRRALLAYIEAGGEPFDDAGGRIPELIADLLHLASEIDRRADSAEGALRKARASFARGRGPTRRPSAERAEDE